MHRHAPGLDRRLPRAPPPALPRLTAREGERSELPLPPSPSGGGGLGWGHSAMTTLLHSGRVPDAVVVGLELLHLTVHGDIAVALEQDHEGTFLHVAALDLGIHVGALRLIPLEQRLLHRVGVPRIRPACVPNWV